jgi:LmbE family N-acetylglucosaminyl deacetylase
MKILVFAPHNDDEILGVGGTIAKFSQQGDEVYVCEITSVEDKAVADMIQQEALQAHKIIGVKQTLFLGLPVVGLKETPTIDLNAELSKVVQNIQPEIAFIPHKGDMHIDHSVVARGAMVALRPVNNPQLKAIYAYETLSETEWNIPSIDNAFIPNVWSDITKTINLKLQAMNCYKSQIKEFPHPRSLEGIEALSKMRGSTICVRHAESFMLIRNVI